ncbi:hypothetical protein [Sediminibacillus massiliensis]|uniref:hypothetical protein n=1 Tax=Sediminibacillus massiliensis TaxID=1926277 RepID=UPI0009885FC6|nr:hypothetical protein [Sediminibacillus massiliensis]
MRKQEGEVCKHFVILKRESLLNNEDIDKVNAISIEKFDIANQQLQEEYFKELGLNIIWIDDYNEIPEILKRLKV